MPEKKRQIKSVTLSRFYSPNDHVSSDIEGDVLRISSDFQKQRRSFASCCLVIFALETFVFGSYRYLSIPPLDTSTIIIIISCILAAMSYPTIWLALGFVESVKMRAIIEIDRKSRIFRLMSTFKGHDLVKKQQIIPFHQILNIKKRIIISGESGMNCRLVLEINDVILPIIDVKTRDLICQVEEEIKRFLLGPYLTTLSPNQQRDADKGYWWFTFRDVDNGGRSK